MRCILCKREASIKTIQGPLCNRCFKKNLEGRVKRNIRQNYPLKKGDRIWIKGKINKYFFELIFPKDYYVLDKNSNKVFNDYSLDDIIDLRINKIITFREDLKILKIMSVIDVLQDWELSAYFNILGNLKFIPREKSEFYNDVLIKINNKYRDAFYSLSKSLNSL